jgi:hypothetical protein
MPPSFAWQFPSPCYPDPAALISSLPNPAPSWVTGLTLHHTWKPTIDQWRGERSMAALGRFYRDTNKWPAGPHLFVAPDGLWVGTPLSVRGVHGGACNSSRIGIEIVGDYDQAPWPPALQARVIALCVALLHWCRAEERMVNGHRECPSEKSCPGRAVNMTLVRSWVGAQLFSRRFTTIADVSNVRAEARVGSAVLTQVAAGSQFPAHPVKGTYVQGSNAWARVKLPSGRVGYIWERLGVLS